MHRSGLKKHRPGPVVLPGPWVNTEASENLRWEAEARNMRGAWTWRNGRGVRPVAPRQGA